MRFYKIKTISRRNLLIVGALAASFLLVAVFCLSLIPSKSLVERAQTIKRGDSKEKVRETLGKPTNIFLPTAGTNVNFLTLLLCVNSETWAYGHWFRESPRFPYFTYNLRLFYPDTNEISITFDTGGSVTSVYIPSVSTNTK